MLDKLRIPNPEEAEKIRRQMMRSARRKKIYETMPDHQIAWLARKAVWSRLRIFHVHSDVVDEMIRRLEGGEVAKAEAERLAKKGAARRAPTTGGAE
jgi:hypothetical protein